MIITLASVTQAGGQELEISQLVVRVALPMILSMTGEVMMTCMFEFLKNVNVFCFFIFSLSLLKIPDLYQKEETDETFNNWSGLYDNFVHSYVWCSCQDSD